MADGTLRLDKTLSTLSQQYQNNQTIFQDILPVIPVVQDSGNYFVYNKDWRLPETVRADKSPANMVTYSVSIGSYRVGRHALKDAISEDEKDNTDSPLELRRDTTEFLVDKIQQRQEASTAQILFTTTTFSSNQALTTATSWRKNTTTANPVANINSGTAVIVANAGVMPNKLIIGHSEFLDLKENTSLHERVKYVQRSIMTADLLAAVFDIDTVHVGKMQRDTSDEGLTSTFTAIWATHALLAFFGGTGRRSKSAGVMLRVMRHGNPWKVRRWRDEDRDAELIEVGTKFIPKAVATSSGFLFTSVTSS